MPGTEAPLDTRRKVRPLFGINAGNCAVAYAVMGDSRGDELISAVGRQPADGQPAAAFPRPTDDRAPNGDFSHSGANRLFPIEWPDRVLRNARMVPALRDFRR